MFKKILWVTLTLAGCVLAVSAVLTFAGQKPAGKGPLAGKNAPAVTSAAAPSVAPSKQAPASTIYATFVLNVHDWLEPEKSIATVRRILAIHEKDQLPLDIYLTDAMVQLYQTEAPDLLQALAKSPYVAISYHVRPPSPYYGNFHKEWFDGLSDADLTAQLTEYETHATDLTTGKPTSAPGGYGYLKQLIGYAPYVVVEADGSDRVSKALAQVYKGMGATFVVRHGEASSLGMTANGLFLRPEDIEIKAYEDQHETDASKIFLDPLKELSAATRPAFVNVKWHENNFFNSSSLWYGVYYADKESRTTPLDPPYDVTAAHTTDYEKSSAQEDLMWSRYEGILQYVKDHPETYTPINAKGIAALE